MKKILLDKTINKKLNNLLNIVEMEDKTFVLSAFISKAIKEKIDRENNLPIVYVKRGITNDDLYGFYCDLCNKRHTFKKIVNYYITSYNFSDLTLIATIDTKTYYNSFPTFAEADLKIILNDTIFFVKHNK